MTKLTLSLPIFALSIFANNVYAGGVSPFYIGAGIGIGYNDTDEYLDDECNKADGTKCSIEDSDTAYHIHGGFHLSDRISVEAGYSNLGTTVDSAVMNGAKGFDFYQDTHAFTLAGVARVPVGKSSPVSIYGKAGLQHWKSEMEVTAIDGAKKVTRTVEESGTSPLIGVGVEYDVGNSATFRAGWDRYYDTGAKGSPVDRNFNPSTLQTDVDVISAGMNYYFL